MLNLATDAVSGDAARAGEVPIAHASAAHTHIRASAMGSLKAVVRMFEASIPPGAARLVLRLGAHRQSVF